MRGWVFPDLRDPDLDAQAGDLIAVGGDLAPETLVNGYASGLFPMPGDSFDEPLGWWSPVSRGVLPLDGLRVTRSMRRSARRFEVTVDVAFVEVMRGCADPGRDGGWIDDEFVAAYTALHELGLSHSVEVWLDGELVGGLYGVALGGLFVGESMFHRAADASKVALMGLVDLLSDEHASRRLLDVQWRTDHLGSLGVVEMPRREYLARLDVALALPSPFVPGGVSVSPDVR